MTKWKKPHPDAPNLILNRKGYYLSYNDNDMTKYGLSNDRIPFIDSSNPETAIVIRGDKPDGSNRYLIYRGDWRKELEAIKSLKKLKEHWKKHGGHFWSDDLTD